MTNDGIYEISSMNNMANSPSTNSSYQHGFMIVGSWNMNLRPVQVVFVGYQELAIFMRAWAIDSSWTSWKRVTLT